MGKLVTNPTAQVIAELEPRLTVTKAGRAVLSLIGARKPITPRQLRMLQGHYAAVDSDIQQKMRRCIAVRMRDNNDRLSYREMLMDDQQFIRLFMTDSQKLFVQNKNHRGVHYSQ